MKPLLAILVLAVGCSPSAPSGPAFNLAAVQDGMSYQEVVAVLGSDGVKSHDGKTPDGTKSVTYEWKDGSGKTASVWFLDDFVVMKELK
jgi:hypothetical protein